MTKDEMKANREEDYYECSNKESTEYPTCVQIYHQSKEQEVELERNQNTDTDKYGG